jgi:hypothetical protein
MSMGNWSVQVGVQASSQGLGRALFRNSGLRVLQATGIIGVRGVLVDAISDDAKAFYLALGMTISPLNPMTLMITLADLLRKPDSGTVTAAAKTLINKQV